MNARPLAPAGATILALAAAVGHWLRDDRGGIVGGVGSVGPGGRTAVVALGVHVHDRVRSVEVPAGALPVADGGATPRGETAGVLDATPGGRR